MDLVIGNTSQLINYFDLQSTNFVSSRNYVGDARGYEKVILTFAEQRTYLNLPLEDYIDVNVDYTLKLVNKLSDNNEKIILFGSSELWNNYNGPVNVDLPFNYKYSHYIGSKQKLIEKVKEQQNIGKLNNVMFIHPFNFNSPYRKDGFLFAKIFDSLINKKKVEVGNINIFRDLIHPKLITEQVKSIENDVIVGSGILTNIKDFTYSLFSHFGLDASDFIIEKLNIKSPHADNFFWSDTEKVYTNLLQDTIIDIERIIKLK
jgi:nucleoside-diphosphate-sugar epimerase